MARYLDTYWCDGCGVEITWGPLLDHHREYCCFDCMQNRPCDCGSRAEQEEDRRRAAYDLTGVPYLSGE